MREKGYTRSILVLVLTSVISLIVPFKETKNSDFSNKVLINDILNNLSPEIKDFISIQYYNITGETEEEIRSQMNSFGPIDHKGIKRDACVKWNISWRWPKDKDGKPDIENTRANYKIQVILPKWNTPFEASKDLILKWENFLKKIDFHEARHLANALKYTELPAKAIREASLKNPSLTRVEANKIGFKVLDQLDKEDRLYDLRTDNGRAENITFP